MANYIFHDPSGRRARRAGQGLGLIVSLAALLVAGFFATLAFAPRLPGVSLKDPRILQALHIETARHVKGRPGWTRVPKPRAASGGPARPLSVGFYVSWDEDSRTSLARNVASLDVVVPQWVALNGSAGDVKVTADPQAEAILAKAPHPVSVLPLVHNAHDDLSDGPLADRMLADPAARSRLIGHLVDLARKRNYAGYVFDFENLSAPSLAVYPAFLKEAQAALKPLGRDIWVSAPVGDGAWPLPRLQKSADAIVLMAYDQHYGTGDPGPAAGQDWFEARLAESMRGLDPAHTVVALGAYGYDWTTGAKRSADAVGFYDATQTAHDADAQVELDGDSLNPTFDYQDDNGADHSVWFLDAATLFNQIRTADSYRPMGYALWRMGAEDPSAWRFMGKPYGSNRPTGLQTIVAGQGVDFDGTGEVLRVSATPTVGKRTLTTDPATGLIDGETYDVMPTSYVVERYGARPGLVALTFDDGPDPRWTPKILDILKAKRAQATFFVIGKNMQDDPGAVRREVAEGQLVGSHTWTHPNIGEISAPQADLELNTTQRLFEVLTGRSLRLFRPPYFGDAEPSTPNEVEPLLTAQKLGYLIVGLRIDPDDWKKPDPQHIIDTTLARLADGGPRAGQIVLLHDGGGDRSRTVAALPGLIDALRAHGYRLVSVDQLAGMTNAQAMPAATRDSGDLLLDRIGFGFFRTLDLAFYWLFITAIVLGVLRLVFLAVLALIHRSRVARRTPELLPLEREPLVSVLIPCFNEEAVIAGSVERILASRWSRLEVLVLDDGSTDGTAEQVRLNHGSDPRVRLLSFANGGKALALNRGLTHARGEIVVALDADTLFAPETIARLVRWFEDPGVGAVAGNAIVGNRINLVTRWQALEYVTAQNLERRALAALGAVTVVPGAVGAWRRAALEQLGGYPEDTLAEDQDLTLAVQRAGWRVEFDPQARAYTEAPDTVGGLLKQRFRWSFGTLQCLWKHRAALWDKRRPVLGFVALPQIWLFQILLTAVAPLVDLAIVFSLVSAVYGWSYHPIEWSPDNVLRPVFYWAAFIFLDLSAGALGMALEKRAPWKDLLWLPAQRFGYRQLMYWVVVKSIVTAIRGPRVGWGKLERRNSAVMDQAA
ncbi:cellulose synthase/poly-beta-1,6-N-acetylglucosamine synthase-like glycosyltransferase/peptidoglycan/xylan/chitin deacetylase (PgdA/CDA1 family)/spore germination protein YaaH [Caulobacter ginsengisoli]|uniref:Chitooligosaccharide deacetylase n=1 Tax=Caulobacter ginsengisoli TaxID=400775 RepID=A0ABU0IW25_9CAUL|nr:glycosyltransferase [Caulobacter ginsengisoli]MDQ0466207.1 cellulose synthase/poly-beta-1,6-N-acetylglucosamine synthase-like glycosyltransferase/peptidoglycan/xylan/chitin deacetylase (PgdA/CDA1 family)/spore germination protein YaaH [Caulobacter ginsengisoli]